MSTFSELFGGGGGGAAEIIALDTFAASGTWNKPAEVEPGDLIVIDMWDGGGSGARHGSNSVSGGAPGIWHRFEFSADALPSSAPVVIGAGGAASGATTGNPGGMSSFNGLGSYSAPGGGASNSTVGNTVPTAGVPFGAGKIPLSEVAETVAANAAGRHSVFCAGQGGGAINLGGGAPGISVVGGDGGTAADGSGTAGDGQVPGGGGGAARGAVALSGAGARGEVRVYVIRGALSVGALVLPASI